MLDKKIITEKIAQIVQNEGFHFVDLKIRPGKKIFIELFIDSDSGITISECTKISRLVSADLDSETTLENYTLDVSSPGIDYPLKEIWQFKKNIGRDLDVIYRDQEVKSKFHGKLVSIDEINIKLMNEDEEEKEIPLSSVESAKVKIF